MSDAFLDETALGLTAGQRIAAIGLLYQLEDGTLKHCDEVNIPAPNQTRFNMNWWVFPKGGASEHCGSVHCIGGGIELLSGEGFTLKQREHLEPLFYPGEEQVGLYNDITPARAAVALRRYLETGNPHAWEKASA